MADHDYEAGLRDGKIDALEKMQTRQNEVLKDHHNRITAQERISWIILGALAFVQLIPTIEKIIK